MRQNRRGSARIGIWAVTLVFVGMSQAQNGTWTGGSGVDNNWNTAGNWVDSVIPGDWQSAFFSSGVVNGTVNNNAWIGHNAITVDAVCPVDIVIGGTSIPKNDSPITVTGANLTFNTDLNVWNSAITFDVANGKTLTFNGRINDINDSPTACRVTINGAGTVVMTRTGLYTGGTVVNGGTLRTTAANGAGPGAMTVAAGAVWDRGPVRHTVAGLSGAGHVTCITSGVVFAGSDGAAQISTNKNYVHVLDFEPGGGGGATVNGVKFTGAGTSGPGWSLTGTANTFGENATLTGYDRLLSGFFYGSTGTLTFSDLVVGNTYEIVVFSSPAWGTRYEDATFTNGTDSHVLQHTNPGDYGYYAYTFLATDSTASITMAPYDTGNTFHWYGATLEVSPPLTVGDASDYLFSGVIDGAAALVKQGNGVQTLAGANAYTEGTKVNAGTLNTAAAGAAGSGAVAVASGATWDIRVGADQTVAGLSGAGTVAAYNAGEVTTGADGEALISTSKNYLKLLDFGNGSGATVNGVTFDNASDTSGTDWTLTLTGTPLTYFSDNGSYSGYAQLMSDFLYNGIPGTLAFHNLTVGQCYDMVLYAQVGVWGGRWQNATFANGPDSIQLLGVDEGEVGYYSYQFKAQAETATIAMAPLNSGNTFHWFAASLETLADNAFTNGVTLTLGDANDYRFEGAINGNLSLVKQGSGKQTLAGPVAYTGPTTIREGTLRLELPSAPAGAVTVANASFETHDALANDTWGYNPTGASWTFDDASGIAAPGSPWVAANATPDGTYAAYVQNNGTLSQEVSIPADGHYRFTLKAANRPGYSASGLNLLIDGVTNCSFAASAFSSQGGFQTVSALAQISAGTHTLTLAGVMTGSDSATAIDNVSITGIGGGLSTNAPVLIASGACLDLGGTTQTVSRLYFDGTEKQPGTHGAPGSGAQYTHVNGFTGSGVLKVLNGKIYSTLVVIR